jgi:hypothetical protein
MLLQRRQPIAATAAAGAGLSVRAQSAAAYPDQPIR